MEILNFKEEVLDFEGSVLVDFWATWCGPCRMMHPIIEQLAEEYAGKIKIAKVNVDVHQEVAESYGIQSIPTFILFKNGEVVKILVGSMSAETLRIVLDQVE